MIGYIHFQHRRLVRQTLRCLQTIVMKQQLNLILSKLLFREENDNNNNDFINNICLFFEGKKIV